MSSLKVPVSFSEGILDLDYLDDIPAAERRQPLGSLTKYCIFFQVEESVFTGELM